MTPNFTLAEFTRSSEADRLGIKNTPTAEHLANLRLTAMGFEMARAILGVPIHITSGYRGPVLNKAVGGVADSAHAKGLAGDGKPIGMALLAAAQRLAASPLVFDQLILETSRGVIHLSFDLRLRREVKTQAGGPGSPVVWGLKA